MSSSSSSEDSISSGRGCRDRIGDTGGKRGVTRAGTEGASLKSIISSMAVEGGGSRDIVGMSSLLLCRLCAELAGRSECEFKFELLVRVFVREARVALKRDSEERCSRTKEFVSGLNIRTNSFALASCKGPLNM
jgi:hypothetical protein